MSWKMSSFFKNVFMCTLPNHKRNPLIIHSRSRPSRFIMEYKHAAIWGRFKCWRKVLQILNAVFKSTQPDYDSALTTSCSHSTVLYYECVIYICICILPPSGRDKTSFGSVQYEFSHSQSLAVLLGKEADGLYGCHDDHHAEGHGNEQHDDVLRPVFQGQLFVLVLLGLHHPRRPGSAGLSVLLGAATIAASSSSSSRDSSRPDCGPRGLLWWLGGFRGHIGLILNVERNHCNRIHTDIQMVDWAFWDVSVNTNMPNQIMHLGIVHRSTPRIN